MTEREAIRILAPETTREELFGTSREEGIKLVEEACKVAVEALEKQDTKAVIKLKGLCFAKSVEGEERYEIDYMCPSCNERVDDDGRGFQQPYCMYCGQKLDWE